MKKDLMLGLFILSFVLVFISISAESDILLTLTSDSPTSEVVTNGGNIYTIELISSSNTTATIKITDISGNSESKEINEGHAKEINRVGVTLITAGELSVNMRISQTFSLGEEETEESRSDACTIAGGSCTLAVNCSVFGLKESFESCTFYNEICCVKKEIENETESTICAKNECILDNKCYSIGYRTSGRYCSPANEFVLQLESDISCNNNFECGSNVCVSGQCIETSFIQKILEWFRKLFAGE